MASLASFWLSPTGAADGPVPLVNRLLSLCAPLALTAVLAPSPMAAQVVDPSDATRPTVGLVLSGGGAKGFAHVGVIRVLEEAGIPIDVVTGTSMGALIGGLYASGYGPDSLQSVATRLPWEQLFSDAVERRHLSPDRRIGEARTVLTFPLEGGQLRLPSGAVEGQSILRLLERLTWRVAAIHDFRRLPIPFFAVATNIETGEAVVLDEGVLANALRASMAIPGVIQPLEIDGRLLVDGGIVRNLPAEDARALGADILICSDVSDPLEEADQLANLVDILLQTVAFQMTASTAEQRALCDVVIDPDIGGLSMFTFEQAPEWIERGVAATRDKLPELRGIAGRTASPRTDPHPEATLLADSVYARAVVVQGLETREARRLAERTLQLPERGWLSAAELDAAVERAYATELFRRVSYRVRPEAGDTAIVIDIEEDPRDSFGFGFRYDDRYKAALLFTTTVYNWLRYGSATRFDLRLGEQLQLEAQYLRGRGVTSPFSIGGGVRFTSAPFDIYADGQRVAEISAKVASVSGLVGTTLGNGALAGVLLTGEWANAEAAIAPTDTAQAELYYTVSGLLWRDTFDRAAFPTRGSSLLIRSERADPSIGSGAEFSHHLLDAQKVVPLRADVGLHLRAVAGASWGDDLPLHRRFFLGGTYPAGVFPETQPPFLGLNPQERLGRALQLLRAGVQWELRDQTFATFSANTGNAFDDWSWAPDDYLFGWGISLGALSFLGPVELTASGRDVTGWPDLAFTFGYRF